MLRFLLIFFAVRVFAEPIDDLTPSAPVEIASLRTDLLIGGLVNPFSGQIACSEKDLHVHAAQDLILRRTYVPPLVLGRYEDKNERDRFELAKALSLSYKGWSVLSHLWCGINGKSRHFQVPDPSGCVLEFQLNNQTGTLVTDSFGMSNLRAEAPGSDADWRNTKLFVDDSCARVQTPAGIERIYRRITDFSYRLEQEVLSNGKVIRYEYQNHRLSKISSTDPSGQFVYASIDVQDLKHFVGSDGTQVDYNYEIRTILGEKKKIHSKNSFNVLTLISNPFYHNAAGYNDRLLLSSYDSKEYPITCQYSSIKDRLAQVSSLSFPVGRIAISYDPPRAGVKGGWTSATDENGSSIIYRFNEKLLLTAIENHNGSLVNQKRFTYDERQHIRSIETSDGQGNVLLTKNYECDEAGNPLTEQWKGDFGTFTIHRRFDNNRLIEESRDDGLSTQWTYLKSTRLITSQTIFDSGVPIRKTTYQFDDACNLIRESEVGRTITDYLLHSQAPHLHRIEWKVEKDWEGRLICKIHLDYDQWGNICTEAVYGSDNVLAYTIERTFNAKGELLHETNPLGQEAAYTFDARSRCTRETPFSHAYTINRTFDAKGRLIQLDEGCHSTKFSYDSTDLLIEKIDYLGQPTRYTYHPVHRKPVRIESSPIVKKTVFDAFGRPILTQDGASNQTRAAFNSYGSPLQIIHPGGGVDLFEYAANGNRIRQVDADGMAATFEYDVLKRLTAKTTGSATTLYRYDAYTLIEETNAEGISTRYSYNNAGQKIREETAGRVITFGYDPLGFLNRIEKAGRITTIQNDVLGRPLEQGVLGRLKTTYSYDSVGNTASVTKRGTTYFHYDPYHRLIEKTDPLGNQTAITYVEGDRSLIKKIKDPRGIETVEYYDAHNCQLKKEIDGILTQEFAYDSDLRKSRQDHLTFTYTPDGCLASTTEAGERTTRYSYTPAGRLQSKQLPDGQILSYEYNPLGVVCRIGDQSIEYDKTGRLIGGSGFRRSLDAFGNILKEEFETGLCIESQYDEQDRPLERILPDHSKIVYEYNPLFLERIRRLSPNGELLYTHTYDLYSDAGDLLLEDQRTSYEYDLLGRETGHRDPYLEETCSYDPQGNLIQKGKTAYSFDALSQMTSESDHFTARYDPHYNRIEMNGKAIAIDALNQMPTQSYDANGRLLRDGYAYDIRNRLIATPNERLSYDVIGRRLTKGSTSYLYLGDEEIGSYADGLCQELQIPGLKRAAAIEKASVAYLPIYDVQGTIRYLVDRSNMRVTEENAADTFGRGLNPRVPYAYAGKRFDPATGLIYFGQRYYDPNLGRWLTQDPAGSVDSSNLYQYVFNNPYRYIDPNGESVIDFIVGLGEMVGGGVLLVTGCALEIVTFGGFTFGVGFTSSAGIALMSYGAYQVGRNAACPARAMDSVARTLHTSMAGNAASSSLSYLNYSTVDAFEYRLLDKKGDERRSSDEPGSPPHRGDELGNDPTRCPGKGFEWKGNGEPGSRQGKWVKGPKGSQEGLYPDLDHPKPIGPHWDYEGPDFPKGARLYPDGTWSPK